MIVRQEIVPLPKLSQQLFTYLVKEMGKLLILPEEPMYIRILSFSVNNEEELNNLTDMIKRRIDQEVDNVESVGIPIAKLRITHMHQSILKYILYSLFGRPRPSIELTVDIFIPCTKDLSSII